MSIEKTSKRKPSEPKQRKPKKISTSDKTGDIKEASIAKFMRKRTQLVGFDYGHYKHTQYAVEFIDNALDAIEKFQWDAETSLESLKNKTANAIAEFEGFEYDAKLLMEKVANNEPDLVDPLKKLYNTLPNIIKKIEFVNEQIQNLVEDSIGETEPVEFIPLKGSITSSNFSQTLEAFKKEYERIRDEYNKIIDKIAGMDKDPQYTFTLDKETILQNLKYISNGSNGSTNSIAKQNNGDSTSESNTLEIEEMDELEPTLNLNSMEQESSLDEKLDDEEVKELQKLQKKEKDLEIELHTLVDDLEQFLAPVKDLVDNEPI